MRISRSWAPNASMANKPRRLVVIAPVAYRPRKGSKLLYRQPAYLIRTDPDLSLERLVQYYLWRWDIEVNHRDEKQIIGVGQHNASAVLPLPKWQRYEPARRRQQGIKATRH